MAIEMPAVEIKQRMDAGDMEVINGVLSKEIIPVEESAPVEVTQEPVQVTQEPVEEIEQPIQTVEEQPVETGEPPVEEPSEDPNQKYLELKEQQWKEELEQRARALKLKEQEIDSERKAREELEQELQRLKERVDNPPVITINEEDDEEDEFVTEYDKRTRRELQEIKDKLPEIGNDRELLKRLETLESTIKEQREVQERIDKEKAQKEKKRKVFDDIKDLQNKHPEIMTSEPFDTVHEKYLQFRKDISTLMSAKSAYDLESAIEDYMKGGRVKQKADENGIAEIQDLDKYFDIMSLIDEKRGVTYDKYTGKEIPIVDEAGNRVVRRSLDEAYILKNYNKDIKDARQKTYKEVQKKLEYVNNAPVTLDEKEVTPLQGGLTQEQIKSLIALDPRKIKDSETKALYDQAFRVLGLEPPKRR